jgi:acetolactate synthase small subunit
MNDIEQNNVDSPAAGPPIKSLSIEELEERQRWLQTQISEKEEEVEEIEAKIQNLNAEIEILDYLLGEVSSALDDAKILLYEKELRSFINDEKIKVSGAVIDVAEKLLIGEQPLWENVFILKQQMRNYGYNYSVV